MWPRANFRFYVMLLCSVYFAMLYVFHGRLQHEISRLPDDVAAHHNSGHDTGEMGVGQLKSDPKRKVLESKSQETRKHWSGESSIIVNVKKQISSSEKVSSDLKAEDLTSNQHDIKSAAGNETEKLRIYSEYDRSCFLPADYTARRFQAVEAEVFVYSGYLDERKNGTRIVRVMTILAQDKTKRKVEMFCHFGLSVERVTVQGTFYELCENHGKRFGGFILSCDVPETLADICHVNVSVKVSPLTSRYVPREVTEVTVPVTNLQMLETKEKFTYSICVPPLFGNINIVQLVEFIEMNILLGFDHFIFYDYNIINKDAMMTLEAYSQRGLVTLIKWNLPSVIPESKIWYHGQLSSHNDCLYRGMTLTKYLAIIDIDEYIVPHDQASSSLDASVGSLFSPRVCGLSFDSAFYDPNFSTSKIDTRLITASRTGRSSLFSKVRTKVLVDPRKIFEVGIHHISKPLEENYKVSKVNTSIAYLHHYRTCVPNYGMKCNKHHTDDTMLKFYSVLKYQVDMFLHEVLGWDIQV